MLGTEFADDFVITAGGIFGAGLNVRYANVEVIEVDGLEGDDEFFVQSTAFGVAYRVIGGLGSDTINVTGDVTEDIVTRELEGLMGTIDHRVTSPTDPLYNGLPVDGLDYNLATPDVGVVVIEESGPGTSVREGGSLAVGDIDYYDISLAFNPDCLDRHVHAAHDVAGSREGLRHRVGRALAAGGGRRLRQPGAARRRRGRHGLALPRQRARPASARRRRSSSGTRSSTASLVDENGRALVLTFDSANWQAKQRVYLWAVDELGGTEIDPLAEGTQRVHVIQHSVISNNPLFDGALVRNVEATIYDNDTPGVFVTQIEKAAVCPGPLCVEDKRTVVVEGFDDPAVGGALHGHRRRPADPARDERRPTARSSSSGSRWTRPASRRSSSSSSASTARWTQHADGLADALHDHVPRPRDLAERLGDAGARARQRPRRRPARGSADGRHPLLVRPDAPSAVCGVYDPTTNPTATYQFPNLRSGPGLTAVTVIDNETAGAVIRESGVGTLVYLCGDATCSIPGQTDDYWLRLTKRPENPNDLDHNPATMVADRRSSPTASSTCSRSSTASASRT